MTTRQKRRTNMEHIDMTDAAAEFIDNQGVADFADAMRRKLEKKRAEGRGGWHDPDREVARIAEAAAKIPPGEPGDCDLCGEWSGRLVNGACARCRDKYKLP